MGENGYSFEFIQKLKAQNDIISIISKYVRLEKKGRNYWGCCPFHHEKTPSFCINQYEQFYHCFGCGESGDVITFLRKYENMDYHEAVEFLAKNVGMEIPKFHNDEKYLQNKKIKDKSLTILNLARDFYKAELYKTTAKVAQDYIKSRKLTKRELDNFELGYSPDYNSLVNYLRGKNFTDKELKQSGACEINHKGTVYDFEAGRLIFPIVNVNGDCIGFSGRDLTGSSTMKYKNTSATLVFDKSKTIYAINLIKKLKQAQQVKDIIIVEGQFDVITMHRYGFNNTVACMGTAMTKEHIRDLSRFADNVILFFDGDEAGRKATIRAIDVLNNSDLNVKVAILPDGQDPDEYLQKFGAEGVSKLLENAVTPMMFKILLARKNFDIKKIDEKTKFIKYVLGEISKLTSKSEQAIYLEEVKKVTGISVEVLRRDLTKSVDIAEQATGEVEEFPNEFDAQAKAIKFILASHLFDKEYINQTIDLLPYLKNADYIKLYNLIKDYKKNGKKLIISTLFDVFDVENDKNLNDIINYNFEILNDLGEYYNECLWNVVETELKFRKSNLSKQYNQETAQDEKIKILMEINKINNILKNKIIGEM